MTASHWAGKTVVVTGGSGFIGSHFTEELLGLGAHVVCLYRRDNRGVLPQLPRTDRLRTVRMDLRDEHALRRVFEQAPDGVDAFVHCAVVSGSQEFRRDHSATILDANVRSVSNILETTRRYGVGEIVLLSSSDIYLSPTDQPTREEEDFTTLMRYDPDGYYLSKNYAEILAEAYRTEHGMNIFLPRLTSVYGPRDNFEADTDRVVPTMFGKVMSGRSIEIWGDGSQTRTYMYVTDLVRSVLRMVERNKHQIMNVGTPETVSVLQLARMVCEALGRPEQITFDRSKSGGRQSRTLDLGRLHGIIDFQPLTLREGLRRTADWYLAHRTPASEAR
ncbi:NAD-dependent epimerase/dehydratase family protein [Streptomyces sp. NPDC056503]|uniref:NAD-dependent epimerase/dehydratase family protein n=1 Tax=Streptomyces sp. NPDC056503 TaxID=3345842 RepID=UPI00367A3CE0